MLTLMLTPITSPPVYRGNSPNFIDLSFLDYKCRHIYNLPIDLDRMYLEIHDRIPGTRAMRTYAEWAYT